MVEVCGLLYQQRRSTPASSPRYLWLVPSLRHIWKLAGILQENFFNPESSLGSRQTWVWQIYTCSANHQRFQILNWWYYLLRILQIRRREQKWLNGYSTKRDSSDPLRGFALEVIIQSDGSKRTPWRQNPARTKYGAAVESFATDARERNPRVLRNWWAWWMQQSYGGSSVFHQPTFSHVSRRQGYCKASGDFKVTPANFFS